MAEVRQALSHLQNYSSTTANSATRSLASKTITSVSARAHQLHQTRTHHLGGRNRNSTSSGNQKIVACCTAKSLHEESEIISLFFLGTSSVENKYETIEKSLSPYRIRPSSTSAVERPIHVSIRKQLELQHQSPSSPLCFTVGQIGSCSPPPSSTPSSSSHYAQISPLRGVGVNNTHTYFQVGNEEITYPSTPTLTYMSLALPVCTFD